MKRVESGALAARWRLDDLRERASRVMAGVDYMLVPIGWMFGLMFFTFGAMPIFTGDGGHVGLLALGIGLFALSRAAAAAIYARRHGCRCGGAGLRREEERVWSEPE